MRLVTFLLMGIIPQLALSQLVCRVNLLEAHPYDTLQKYSYLIVSMRRDEKDHKKKVPLAVGTGFFLRKDKQLFLVTARHVFTNCDIYTKVPKDDKPVAIKVWYQDTLERTGYQTIPLPDYKIRAPCESVIAVEDVDTMDVSNYFKDGRINSIDHLMPDYYNYNTLRPCDTVVSYGFSLEPSLETIEKYPNLIPVGYIAYSRDSPDDQVYGVNEQLSTSYYAIEPGLPPGVSGAPVFRVSSEGTNKKVEFAGIQSGTKQDWKVSFIVQGKKLSGLYHLK